MPAGHDSKIRKNLVKRKKASMLPIRTTLEEAIKSAGLDEMGFGGGVKC